MYKHFFVFFLLLSVVLLGCSKVKTDLDASADALKTDFQNTKSEVEAGIDGTKQFFTDVKNAAVEVKEAKEAVEKIGN